MSFKKVFFTNDLSCFLQGRINCYLAGGLPLSIFRRIIHFMGFIYYTFHLKEATTIAYSIKRHLKKLTRDVDHRAVFRSYIGIFDHYYEKLATGYHPLGVFIKYIDQQIDMPDRQWVEQLIASGQGGIFLTAHFGAVEYLPVYFGIRKYRPTIVLRFKTRKLKEALSERAQQVGIDLIDAEQGNVAFRIIDAVKRGRILITLCDEFKHWRASHEDSVCFLGCNAPSDRTLEILYRRTRAPVCIGLMLRDGKRYTLRLHPIATGDESISIVNDACKILSGYVMSQPEQWYQWKDFEKEFQPYAEMNRSYAPV